MPTENQIIHGMLCRVKPGQAKEVIILTLNCISPDRACLT